MAAAEVTLRAHHFQGCSNLWIRADNSWFPESRSEARIA